MPLHPSVGTGVTAFVFDAYGTIFDVHSAVMRHGPRIGPHAQALSDVWRMKQLEYSWVLSLAGRWRNFWDLTEDALDFALARFVRGAWLWRAQGKAAQLFSGIVKTIKSNFLEIFKLEI